MALLAGVFSAEGVSFVLVGGAALAMREVSGSRPVKDIDIVVEPSVRNLAHLHRTLNELAVNAASVPPLPRLTQLGIVSVSTVYGDVDCLLQRGRADWRSLRSRADAMRIADVQVWVAALADCLRLRWRFKGNS